MFNSSTHAKDREIGRLDRIWPHGSSFSLDPDTTPPQEVDAPIVSNPEQPRGKRTALVVLLQLPMSLE
jgi:hypothetical protein